MPRRALAVAVLLASLIAVSAASSAPNGRSGTRAEETAATGFVASNFIPANHLDSVLVQADSLVARRGGAHADSARLYLSWNRPWGMRGASATHMPNCGRPDAADTLYLCFLPGRTCVGFCSFSAQLYFRAAPGDTLGPYWQMEKGGGNHGELTIDCGPDETFPQRQPWPTAGMMVAHMDRTPASAHLILGYAVAYNVARPVAPDSVYTLARVILHHHHDLRGCRQPVAVEWASAQLGFWLHDEPIVNRGERFAAYAGDLKICDPFRRSAGAWEPRGSLKR
ncbi:MAG TPA: hypothetical protein VMH61_08065 [Candidatus Acidoferrales bacterium]|nr:hypothetical protein [Candidatus Acidoferrales bacterium]